MYQHRYFLTDIYEETLRCDTPGTALAVIIAFPTPEEVLCQGESKGKHNLYSGVCFAQWKGKPQIGRAHV